MKGLASSIQQTWADTIMTIKTTTLDPRTVQRFVCAYGYRNPILVHGQYGPAEGQRFTFSYNNQQCV